MRRNELNEIGTVLTERYAQCLRTLKAAHNSEFSRDKAGTFVVELYKNGTSILLVYPSIGQLEHKFSKIAICDRGHEFTVYENGGPAPDATDLMVEYVVDVLLPLLRQELLSMHSVRAEVAAHNKKRQEILESWKG